MELILRLEDINEKFITSRPFKNPTEAMLKPEAQEALKLVGKATYVGNNCQKVLYAANLKEPCPDEENSQKDK